MADRLAAEQEAAIRERDARARWDIGESLACFDRRELLAELDAVRAERQRLVDAVLEMSKAAAEGDSNGFLLENLTARMARVFTAMQGALAVAHELDVDRRAAARGPGEWRCKCPAEPGFDRGANPSYVAACTRCGETRPAK